MFLINIFNSKTQTVTLLRRKLVLVLICLVLTYGVYRCLVRERYLVTLICFCLLIFIAFQLNISCPSKKQCQRKMKTFNRAVLITGCDTGFGNTLAKRLSKGGFQVFAGCLSPVDKNGKELFPDTTNIHCFKMDVSQPEDIEAAVAYVTQHLGENELWAIVNNAGISKGSEVEVTPMAKIEAVLDVNLLGTIRVTKAFLHLIRQSKGRLVNVGSAAGRLMMPGFIPYSLSKNAVIFFSDGLRLEMQKFCVSVITIEPWMYRSRISDPSAVSEHIKNQWKTADDNVKNAYSGAYAENLQKKTHNLFSRLMNPNTDEVIDVMEEAITSDCPLYHYRPGKWYLNVFLWIMGFLPKVISDYIMCEFIFRSY